MLDIGPGGLLNVTGTLDVQSGGNLTMRGVGGLGGVGAVAPSGVLNVYGTADVGRNSSLAVQGTANVFGGGTIAVDGGQASAVTGISWERGGNLVIQGQAAIYPSGNLNINVSARRIT